MVKWILLALVAAATVAGFFILRERSRAKPPPPPEHVTPAQDTFALLVGCTEYPELAEISDPEVYESTIRLLGPGNDARLMHSVLRQYLGVPEANIRLLAGWPDDPQARPTRSNILGHLDRLAREVPSGAQVMFLFAGHGSQQPDDVAGEETDGQDEILLPADAGRWDPALRGVAGVIKDDEIWTRLLALRDAGATVWAVFDCCHSGTMMRGGATDVASEGSDFGEVRMRSLSAEILGIPSSAVALAARGVGAVPVGGILDRREESSKGIGVISAASSWEQAPEMILPRSRWAADREAHGLCTFHVARTLQHYGGSLTLAEIFEHVRASYASLPWSDATPVAEGDLSLRALPGARQGAALLLRWEAGRLVLDAGSLRGLTVGSRLNVYRPGGFLDPAAMLGPLVLTEVELLRSTCGALPGGPDPSDIPGGAPVEVAEIAPGGLPLCLAMVDVAGTPLPAALVDRLRDVIAPDARARAHFPFVEAADADWHVRDLPIPSDGIARFLLSPASAGSGIEPLEVSLEELAAVLERIRRADSLRRYAQSGPPSKRPDSLVVEVRIRRFGAETTEPFVPGIGLLPGDRILLRLANDTGRGVDAVIRNLDAAQSEFPVWPQHEPSYHLSPDRTDFIDLGEMELSDDGLGRESLIVVSAVRSEGAAVLDVGTLSGSAVAAGDGIARRQRERALLAALTSGGAQPRGADAEPVDTKPVDTKPVDAKSVETEPADAEPVDTEPADAEPAGAGVITEIHWISTWGRLASAASLNAGMTPLDPPLTSTSSAPGAMHPSGRRWTWTHAVVLPGDEETADVLLLTGVGEAGTEGAFAIFVDEDGDARLEATDAAKAARLAVAGTLPVELMLLSSAGRSSASYPRQPGDLALGMVRVQSEVPDRAGQQHDLLPDGWEVRETCGPWLSTAFVPLGDGDPAFPRRRMVLALRRFFLPR